MELRIELWEANPFADLMDNRRRTPRRRRRDSPPTVAILVAVVLGGLVNIAGAADDLQRRVDECRSRYTAALDVLAKELDTPETNPLAAEVRKWNVPRRTDIAIIWHPQKSLPAESDKPLPPARLRKLRQEQAQRLYDLARQASTAKDVALSYELLGETLREDPDHAAARQVLGFVRHDGAWLTPYARQQTQAGRIWHERFGWIKSADAPRYEQGERPAGARWATAEEDAKAHADIRRGWQVETEHFLVTTNHSLEAGVRLAANLEQLDRAWRQIFAAYWLTPAQLEQRFTAAAKPPAESVAKPRPTNPPKHRVTYFLDQQEYIRALQPAQPRIAMSLGVYLDSAKTAYFFAGEQQHPGTVWHEATHQKFKESRSTVKLPGKNPNFWIVEAVACYMESRTPHDGYDTLGERSAGRFPAARERLVDDRFYVPLVDLVPLTADDLHRDERIAKIYSQSAGLATFLLHAHRGRHRPALVRYLEAVYTGKATPTTLATLTGVPLADLDQQYQRFLLTGEEVRRQESRDRSK